MQQKLPVVAAELPVVDISRFLHGTAAERAARQFFTGVLMSARRPLRGRLFVQSGRLRGRALRERANSRREQ